MTTKTTIMALSFVKEDKISKLMSAISFEEQDMAISALSDSKTRIEKSLANENSALSETKLASLREDLAEVIADIAKAETKRASYEQAYSEVVSAMALKNENHFGNDKDSVRNVLRVLATAFNEKLTKYAITSTIVDKNDGALMEAMDLIHISGKFSEDGEKIMSQEQKVAYANARAKIETLVKSNFSLPFETEYTQKFRVKLTEDDLGLLHEVYVRGFKNVFESKDGKMSFKEREVRTLITSKKNRKTGLEEYNYDKFKVELVKICVKHFFA